MAAGRDGGRGSLCVSRLTLVERQPDPPTWPQPQETVAGRTLSLGVRTGF